MIPIADASEFKSSEIPTNPGVYLYRDEAGEILYIGKAKSLRSRVKSYFSKTDKPAKTQQLVSKIRNIDWIIVNNEVEALLLENKLVKQHTPKYNINLKDAKTFAYIALTREPFPRILTSRKVSRKLESFGPYTDGYTRQDLQRLVVRVFKLRVCRKLPKRACLNFHIGLCSAPCNGNVSPEQYAQLVEQARSFLGGDYEKTTTLLLSQMQVASQEQQYERALELRNQIASIRLLTQRQIVDTERRFDQDVMAFRRLGEKVLAVQMGVRKGVLLGKKEFTVDLQPQVEQEFLKAFYATNQIPREILLNKPCWESNVEKAALEEFFSSKRGAAVSLTVPSRGHKLDLVRLAEKNLESTLDEDSALVDLQTALNLPVIPHIVECFDISNLGEEHVVSGMVRFTDAKPDKRNYRKFKIKTVAGQDDFASMGEVVTRRYKGLSEEKAALPDLVVIDGGPGQVSAAEAALKSLGLQIPLIGLAKEHEEIYLPNEQAPLRFDKNSRMMLFLRRVRDETHRFSLGYNLKRRQMKLKSEFEQRQNGS
jgi:excinuclease ABC subunit C